MKKLLGCFSVVVVSVFVFGGIVLAEPTYVTSKKCKMCHKKVEYSSWLETKHAKAFESLASDEAKKIAKERKIDDPQKAKECYQCHVTGYNEKDGSYSEENIACEACHGPGSDYKKMKVMKDVEAAKKAGLNIPTEETCKKCHNKKSPSYKEFKFEERRSEVHNFKNPPDWAKKEEKKTEE